MIAVDTQLLVYAHRADSPHHAPARALLAGLAESGERWAIAVHSLVELYANVTGSKYPLRSTPRQAIDQVDAWQASGGLVLLTEDEKTWAITRDLVLKAGVHGPRAYDARIAAVCLQHGVTELWTCDRDFAGFPDLRTRNPLVAQQPTHAGEARAEYAPRARATKPVAAGSAGRTPIAYARAGSKARAAASSARR